MARGREQHHMEEKDHVSHQYACQLRRAWRTTADRPTRWRPSGRRALDLMALTADPTTIFPFWDVRDGAAAEKMWLAIIILNVCVYTRERSRHAVNEARCPASIRQIWQLGFSADDERKSSMR